MNWKIDMAWLANIANFTPRTVCECAVGPIDISIAPAFSPDLGGCKRLLLIEPLERFAAAARRIPGAEVHQVAIGAQRGKGHLLDNGGSSYLAGSWAPTMPGIDLQPIKVEITTFDTLDDGEIDILNLDCEGQEWWVLKKMRSLPRLLAIEVWRGHPHTHDIFSWLESNRYVQRLTTGPTAETMLYSRYPS